MRDNRGVRWVAVLLLVSAAVQAQGSHAPGWPQVTLLFKKSGKRFDKKVFKAAGEKAFKLEKLDRQRERDLYKEYKPYGKEMVFASFSDWHGLFVHGGRKNYFGKESDAAAVKAPDPRSRKVVHDHKSWFSLIGATNEHQIHNYTIICKLAVELADDDLLAYYFPDFERYVFPDEKDLKKKMRSKDPLVALGLVEAVKKPDRKLTEEEEVILQAVREARADWDVFREAVVEGDGHMHWVTFGDPLDPKKWRILDVTSIGKKSVSGKLLGRPNKGRKEQVTLDQVVDWSYMPQGRFRGIDPRDLKDLNIPPDNSVGNYVRKALVRWAQKKKGK
ncbi:MAG: hypothetical protein ACYTGN_14625 [Planctomycetota bacterium]|jgi:hypothetical protein